MTADSAQAMHCFGSCVSDSSAAMRSQCLSVRAAVSPQPAPALTSLHYCARQCRLQAMRLLVVQHRQRPRALQQFCPIDLALTAAMQDPGSV